MSPYEPTPQEVVAALLQDPGRPNPAPRPQPAGKELRATLAGKAAAMPRLAQRVAQRDGPHIQLRVALTDGAEALQQQLLSHFPQHTLILDVIHATEYLWNTANTLVGETHPPRTAWVRADLEPLLAGQTAVVITAFEAEGSDPTHTVRHRQAVRRTVDYYRRNRPSMRDDEYLAHGWPIGTGVVEGACGHLVKDRLEQSGMRWTPAGAQGVLDLRAVRLNGHWEADGPLHRQQQHQRLYGLSTPAPVWAEAQALEWVAGSTGCPQILVTLNSFHVHSSRTRSVPARETLRPRPHTRWRGCTSRLPTRVGPSRLGLQVAGQVSERCSGPDRSREAETITARHAIAIDAVSCSASNRRTWSTRRRGSATGRG